MAPPGDFSVLERLADGTLRRTMKDQMVYAFNADNQLASMQDRNGNATQYLYNDAGQFIKLIDPVGLETTFTYTGDRITAITDPANRVTQLLYDAEGNLEKIIDPDTSARTFKYDDEHHMVGEVDKRGHEEKAVYDFAGRVKEAIRKDDFGIEEHPIQVTPVQVQGLYAPEQTTDPFNIPVASQLSPIPESTYVDANQDQTISRLDQAGQLVTASDEIGQQSFITRNGENLVTLLTDARDFVTRFVYDDRGNLLSTEEFDSSVVSWIGGSGFWDDPTNWSTGEVPDADDFVILDVPEDATITYQGNGPSVAGLFSEEQLEISQGSFTVSENSIFSNRVTVSGGTLVSNGVIFSDGLTLNGGRLVINGDTFAEGQSTWSGGTIFGDGFVNIGELDITAGSSLIRLENGTLTNAGTIIQEGGIIRLYGADIQNDTGALYELKEGNITPGINSQSFVFNNEGTLRKSTGSTTNIEVNFNNLAGNLDVRGGTLKFVQDSTFQGGRFGIASGAAIDLSNASRNGREVALTYTFSGEINDLGEQRTGTSTRDQRIVIPGGNGTLRFDSSNILAQGKAQLDLRDSTIEWVRGTIVGDELINQGLMRIVGDVRVNNSILTNQGTIIQDQKSNLQQSNLQLFNSELKNGYEAVFEIKEGNIGPAFGSSSFVFNNSGDLQKNSTGISNVAVNFNNNGIVEALDGVLRFTRPVVEAGGRFENNGGTIQFASSRVVDNLLPDLQINNVQAPATVQLGGAFDLGWTVENGGEDATSSTAWVDAVFVSQDDTLDADDVLVTLQETDDTRSPLSTGGTYVVNQNTVLPEDISLGNQFLLFVTDWTSHQLESNEINNVTAKAVEITASPEDGSSIPTAPQPETALSLGVGAITQYEYDPIFNQVTRIVDELGHETLLEIDPETGNTLSITEVVGEIGGDDDVITRFTYTPQGLVDLQTDALGRVTDYDYDNNGNLTQMTFAVGTADEASQQMEYDIAGNLIASVDENGNRTEFEYDALNRLVKTIEADPDGTGPLTSPITTFIYDADGNLISVTDELSNTQLNTYDELGRMIESTDAEDNIMGYSYDALGNITSTTDALGRVTTNQYDERNRLIQTVDADGGTTQYAYDLNDNLISTIDAEGNETEFVYDFRDRLVQTIDALGNTIDYEYDAADNLISQSDQNGNRTTFEYDDLDRQTAIIDAEGNRTTFEYDLVGNLVALVDAKGNRTTYDYDARNRQTAITDALGQTTTTDYDGVGNITAITNALGNTTTFGYDGLNRQTSITDALGNITRTNYDAIGNITAIIDALGNTTTYAYDKIYRQTDMTDAQGNTTSYAYDAVSNLTAVTNALGNTTTYAYDKLNRQTRITNPLGHLTQMGYDKVGNLTSLTDARGHTTTFGYDELNRQTTVTDALDQVTTTVYDGVGNILSITDPLDHTTTFGYDKINRQTTVADALNHTTTTTYDGVGNITAVTDALGHATTYTYDDLNRQISMTDAEDGTTTTAYDAVDNITAITDPVGNTTTFGYDALNRVIAETNELNQTRTHRYDAVGNLVETTDRNGRTREFAYDALYRQTQESWLDGSGSSIRDINFTYDAIGQLLTSSDPDSSYSYTYDAANRLTTVSNAGTPSAPEVVLSYTYDENGNMLTTTDTIDGDVAGTTAYTYDVLNRLSQVTQSGNGVAEKRVDMSYDAASRMTDQTRYSDLDGTQLVASTDYTYDDANRLTELSHSQGATDIATYSYSYDAANRITQITSPDGTSTYNYDDRDQLTDADYTFQTDEGYTYDDNGNRTNPGYQTGPNNQLLNDGTYSYEYDDEGNRTSRTDLATGEVTEYVWDYRNRLDDVITTDSTGTVLSTADYTYDVYDRRITKAVDANAIGTPETEYLVYDGDHIALSFDDSSDLTHRYLYGANIDQILADENAQGEILWPLTDHQGTVRDLIDSTGTVQNHLTYSSFGEITSETNPNVDHRFSYTGREFDDETGQYFYRARYYDAATGKFISEDPLGFEPGDPNLFRYVVNNAVNALDPFGLDGLEANQKSNNSVFDWTIGKLERGTHYFSYLSQFSPLNAMTLGNDPISGMNLYLRRLQTQRDLDFGVLRSIVNTEAATAGDLIGLTSLMEALYDVDITDARDLSGSEQVIRGTLGALGLATLFIPAGKMSPGSRQFSGTSCPIPLRNAFGNKASNPLSGKSNPTLKNAVRNMIDDLPMQDGGLRFHRVGKELADLNPSGNRLNCVDCVIKAELYHRQGGPQLAQEVFSLNSPLAKVDRIYSELGLNTKFPPAPNGSFLFIPETNPVRASGPGARGIGLGLGAGSQPNHVFQALVTEPGFVSGGGRGGTLLLYDPQKASRLSKGWGFTDTAFVLTNEGNGR